MTGSSVYLRFLPHSSPAFLILESSFLLSSMESLCLTTTFPPVRRVKHLPIATTRKPLIIRATDVCNPAAKTLISSDPMTVTYSETSSPPQRMVSPDYEEGYLGAVPARQADFSREGIVKAMRCLTNILSSKVYDISTDSPLQLAPNLSRRLGLISTLAQER